MNERRFTCNACGIKLRTSELLKKHHLRVHGEEFSYPCTSCPFKSKTLNELKEHLLDMHGISMNPQKYFDG
jgi:Zinc finger, C2H2 type